MKKYSIFPKPTSVVVKHESQYYVSAFEDVYMIPFNSIFL
jgi:hypothetical protein